MKHSKVKEMKNKTLNIWDDGLISGHIFMLIVLLIFLAFFSGQIEPAIGNEKPEQTVYSSAELIKSAKELDGQNLIFQGEVIGSIMHRSDGTWLNVSDGLNAVGIFDISDESKKIKMTGRYQQAGDIVTVEGKFNKACPTHNGELDIHATSITIETRGLEDPEILGPQKIAVAMVLISLAALIFVVYIRRSSEVDKNNIEE